MVENVFLTEEAYQWLQANRDMFNEELRQKLEEWKSLSKDSVLLYSEQIEALIHQRADKDLCTTIFHKWLDAFRADAEEMRCVRTLYATALADKDYKTAIIQDIRLAWIRRNGKSSFLSDVLAEVTQRYAGWIEEAEGGESGETDEEDPGLSDEDDSGEL